MLALEPQRKIVEKVLRTKDGRFVRAVFLVTEYQGRLHVKLLSATPVSSDFNTPVTEALPGEIKRIRFELEKSFGEKPVISPFTDFAFLISQPTRAPSGSF